MYTQKQLVDEENKAIVL